MSLRLIATWVFACLLTQQPWAAGMDLLDEVRAGNRSALDSIGTLHCIVAKSAPVTPQGPVPKAIAEYWSSGNLSRFRTLLDHGSCDSVVGDTDARSVMRIRHASGKEDVQFTIGRMDPTAPHGPMDPWALGLLKLCGPKGWPRSLEDLLMNPHQLKSVDRKTEDGKDFIVVALSLELLPNEKGDFEIWFDPRANYMASKLTGTSAHGKALHRRESRVVSFKEVLPTIYFPERVETLYYHDDDLARQEVVEFSEIEINRPVSPDMFVIAIPPNARVFDEFQGVEYHVDTQGNRIGAARSLASFPPLQPGAEQPGPTLEEEGSWSRVIVLCSLGIFVIAGSLWFIRRMRCGNAS